MNDAITHALLWLTGIIAAVAGLVAAIAYSKVGSFKPKEEDPEELQTPPEVPVSPSMPPSPPVQPPLPPKPEIMDFSTPKKAWHSVRVLCDEAGLTYAQKNVICACIFQESEFDNRAVGKNPQSTDWGIVQCNDKYHIGPGKGFPSVQWVLDHPKEMVQWMIRMQKAGQLTMWASYGLNGNGPYKQWLSPTSRMWALAK